MSQQRKKDHLSLIGKSIIKACQQDKRFHYEPLFSSPGEVQDCDLSLNFLGKHFAAPLWISSITGGYQEGEKLNQIFALLCREFELGMSTGSIRPLLNDSKRKKSFDLRPLLGKERPFYLNIGIAQIEELLASKELARLTDIISDLDADGLVIHINPLQELMQEEGDCYKRAPLSLLEEFLVEVPSVKTIVKEVGQGFGPRSLEALLHLPLVAIEFAALGGSNFAKLEMQRRESSAFLDWQNLSYLGATNEQMLNCFKRLRNSSENMTRCENIIISGGINSFLDGFFWLERVSCPALYGMAQQILQWSLEGEKFALERMKNHIWGLKIAKSFLSLNEDELG